jgi:hypothetical protein
MTSEVTREGVTFPWKQSCGHGSDRDACPVWRGEGIWGDQLFGGQGRVLRELPEEIEARRSSPCPLPPWDPKERPGPDRRR